MKCDKYSTYNVLCQACDFPKNIKCCISSIPYLSWCEWTGNEVSPESYQEFLDQQDIEEHME